MFAIFLTANQNFHQKFRAIFLQNSGHSSSKATTNTRRTKQTTVAHLGGVASTGAAEDEGRRLIRCTGGKIDGDLTVLTTKNIDIYIYILHIYIYYILYIYT